MVKRYTTVFIALVLVVILLVAAYFVLAGKSYFRFSQPSLQAYAETVFKKCSDASNRPACYDREIPKLMDVISMEEAFEVTALVQEKDQSYLYCHVLSHLLAEKETAKDPSKWKDVITRCPTTVCNNGCSHGALMQKFRGNIDDTLTDGQIEEIKMDLADVCEPRNSWNPREIERSMCYHALGHLFMYITGGKPDKASGLCKTVGEKPDGRSYVYTCTEGVFMSIFQTLEPEDEALVAAIRPSKEDKSKFCGAYISDEFEYHACQKEGWVYFRSEISEPEGLAEFCSYAKSELWQDYCYMGLMNPITNDKVIGRNNFDELMDFCAGLAGKYRSLCIKGAVHRLLQIDVKLAGRAFELCQKASALGTFVQDDCYSAIAEFGALGFIKGSEELKEFCVALPEKWRERCSQL